MHVIFHSTCMAVRRLGIFIQTFFGYQDSCFADLNNSKRLIPHAIPHAIPPYTFTVFTHYIYEINELKIAAALI